MPDTSAPSSVLRVLVVESDPFVQETAVAGFKEEGFEVLEALSTEYALTLLQSRDDIDIVFTEIVTRSKLNGFDLAQMARSIRPRIAVIVVGNELPPGRSKVPPEARFMPKPYWMTEVVRLIRDMMADPG